MTTMTLERMRNALRHASNAWVFNDGEGGLYSLHDIADAIDAEQQQRFECLVAVNDILDGKDTGVGVCSEPWQSVRMRLIELVRARQASTQGEPHYWLDETTCYGSKRKEFDSQIPLCTAPPAAAVPDARKIRLNGNVRQLSYDQGWNACRGAMLNAAPKPEAKEPIHD